MAKNTVNKIIYFDKETINNILQEYNHGVLSSETNSSLSTRATGSMVAEASTKLKLNAPFIARLSFLLTGRIEAAYAASCGNTTTISSTEISEFEKLKPSLIPMHNVQILDIENSSTSLRVAGGYLKILKGGVEGVNTEEFKTVMDSYDGYDTYKINDETYVRFNNSAFVSNYKRNDLLTTTMTLYCIPVGSLNRSRFDFIEEVRRMERLVSSAEKPRTLAELYPSKTRKGHSKHSADTNKKKEDGVMLYDVLYACVTAEIPESDER
ncbi:MAG: DUF6414 family protein [Candidatus Saccharibacteria bacterium]|nr:DUF6414 family protein [Candidatus Saccharibacteria bacterium]